MKRAAQDSSTEDDDENIVTDTSAEFQEIFGDKRDFESWEEFITLFDEFQRRTGSVFKPKNAVAVEYCNEKRVRDIIPEKFVYANLRMVCVHYGEPYKSVVPASKKRKKLLGRNCEAGLNLGYKKGLMRIGKMNLTHSHHRLDPGKEAPIRNVRAFVFSDEMDLIISRAVMEVNPYQIGADENSWKTIVEILKEQNAELKTVNQRLVKKRINFLINRFKATSNGKLPSPRDEMGIILHRLGNQRDALLQNPKFTFKPAGRKSSNKLLAVHKIEPLDETEEMGNIDDSLDDLEAPSHSSQQESEARTSFPQGPSGKSSQESMESYDGDISSFVQFFHILKRKDDQDRRLRQEELRMRRQELAIHRHQMELSQERFTTHLSHIRSQMEARLDLLKKQLEIHANLMREQLEAITGHKLGDVSATPADVASTQYTIEVVDTGLLQ